MERTEIAGIRKCYGKKEVLRGIELELKEGSCAGILGSNGSGKSTLLSILGGVLRADAGQFLYRGRDLLKDQAFRSRTVGYLPQGNPLFEELSAEDNLLLWYEKKALSEALSDGLPMLLGINAFLKVRVSRLSGGMKRRLAMACAAAADPRILLLDEPSAAVDLLCREKIYSYLERYKKDGGSIILTTHDALELPLCDACYLMRDGVLERFDYDGDVRGLAQLLQKAAGKDG
ncbi:MAG: ATP-binding cassette domain-containing protein [Stomatobaculum sp.]